MNCINFTDLIKQKIEVNNWEFLPDITDYLKHYLTKGDLIELSLVCRNYRAQLRNIIFKTLILFTHPVKVLEKYINFPGRRNKFNSIIKDIKRFSIDNPSAVKEIYIRSNLPLYFIRDLLDIFKNIKCFTIMEPKCPTIPILNKLISLNQLKLDIYSNTVVDKSSTEILLNLFEKMKFLEIVAFWDLGSQVDPFFQINSTFTNLTSLVVNNPKTFSSFPIKLPNLVNIEFSKYFKLDIRDYSKLIEFFDINPQLKKLTIHQYLLNDEIFKSIFKLNNLKYLKIDTSKGLKINGELIETENRSIEHIEFTHFHRTEDFKLFFRSCINLSIIEINSLGRYYNMHVELNAIRVIKLLIINRYSIRNNFAMPPLSLLSQFSVVKFNNWDQACKFKKTLDILNGWKFRENYSNTARDYCIIRD